MSAGVLWALVASGFAIVVVRRRTLAIVAVAAQSLLLGALAVDAALDEGHGLALPIAVLVVRGIALPALLARGVRGTGERRVASERFALARLVFAIAVVGAAVSLVPAAGPGPGPGAAGIPSAAVALLVLGIVIAAVRPSVAFQAVGFLVADNGAVLAGLTVDGGVPGAIELALLFDLLVLLAVAGVLGTKIHRRLGTSDTGVMRSLRD